MALSGFGGLTLGKLASFLTFNKSFNMPISQVSQQFNSIIMALAGCDRIFSLLDETPETDEGYVSLVNAKEENGKLTETHERTGLWAWKHTHQADGSVDYKKLEGDVKIKKDLEHSIEGENVIIIEDIIDSGNTLSRLSKLLAKRNPKSLTICTLLDKPERRVVDDVNVDYVGFVIPDKFVVGYGLDYDQRFRNLPYIGFVEGEIK